MKTPIALFLVFLSFTAALAWPPETKPFPVVVPMEILKTGHIVVAVKVNDKGPFRLVFDTGAPITLVTNKLAKEAGVSNKGLGPTPFGAAGQAKVKSMRVGDLEPVEVAVMIMDHPTVSAMSRFFGPIEGIVGHSFFARYKVTLDYQKEKISFEPNGFVPLDAVQNMMKQLLGKKAGPGVAAARGYWGFSFSTEEAAGLKIERVVPGGPAATAGLVKGDALISINERWIITPADFLHASENHPSGKKAILRVLRDGKEQQIEVTPALGL
ncbi:MAG: PDZ domain-containing protein [Gemmataceae bacterium]|nr:PDZ domain-containing protein [Gemmataceae bacterium]